MGGLDVLASSQHDEPDDEAGRSERCDAGDKLERPRERQTIAVRIVARHPEVLALQPERIVGEHSQRRHHENTSKHQHSHK